VDAKGIPHLCQDILKQEVSECQSVIESKFFYSDTLML